MTEPPFDPTPAMRSFPRDGAPPLRAKVVEVWRRRLHARAGLEARISLWRKGKAEGGWLLSGVFAREGGAPETAFAFSGAVDALIDALEAWCADAARAEHDVARQARSTERDDRSPAAAEETFDAALHRLVSRQDGRRLQRFRESVVGEVLADLTEMRTASAGAAPQAPASPSVESR